MWFSTSSGLVYVNWNLNKKLEIPFIKVSKVEVDDSTYFPSTINSELFLNYKPALISFNYTVPGFISEELSYSYLLEGLEDNWSPWKPDFKKYYTNLSPGQYTFLVKSKTNYGAESNVAKFEFTIPTPWYQTVWFYLALISIISSSLFLMYKLRTRQLKEQNKKLEGLVKARTEELVRTNIELQLQYQKIQDQKQSITDSIKYASRIQKWLFKDYKTLSKKFKGLTIFFKPRDIVSGDFYWFGESEYFKIIVVADCTGHGVPGALMTVMGNDYLNEIIYGRKILSPSEILYALDRNVRNTFNNIEDEMELINDGMDIGIIIYNEKTDEIKFSGAKLGLFYKDKTNAITELKGSKFPIGSFQYKMDKVFDEITIKIEEGDVFYLSSDGFQDQFGGINNQKFMKRRFINLLESISAMNLDQQRLRLKEEFNGWKGQGQQTDDVLVIGVQFK